MNHHYPDNYHGYGHNAPGIPSMGYTGGYGDQATMARMVHPREGYQMSHYQMMQQPGGIYSPGFVGQQSGNPYNMGGYSGYAMPGVNQSVVMGTRQGDMNRMSGGNMVNLYYSPSMPPEAHSSPQHGAMSSQSSTYTHSQANPHIQQSHINMMSSQGHHSMPGQPSMTGQSIHGQSGQLAHSAGHSMSQQAGPPHQSSGAYGGQSSPHMVPRAHHVPQHPMRHPTTQQNPQEVADNILQMASAYPSNQTVQVPLKGRPAPYHIPRSPHYSVLHSDHQTSPNPHLQLQSPAASCQASPSPSSSSVKSPTPVLVPVPNPIPSPGISGLRSPCNQGMSPCGTIRSPAHMGSTYSGHSQGAQHAQCGTEGPPLHHGMSPSEAQHYSPCGISPAHNFSPFHASTSAHRNSSMYSPSCDPSSISNPERHQSVYSSPTSSSCSSNPLSYAGTSKLFMGQSTNTHPSVSSLHMSNNPLMSLQKLVMLPETQVIDPKSVVNDTCLSSQDESPKNVNGPAEWLVGSSSHSVGCQGQSSSLISHQQNNGHAYQSQNTNVTDEVLTRTLCTSNSGSPEQNHSPFVEGRNSIPGESSRRVLQNIDYASGSSSHELNRDNAAVIPVQYSVDRNQEKIEAITNPVEPTEQKLEKPSISHDTSNNSESDNIVASDTASSGKSDNIVAFDTANISESDNIVAYDTANSSESDNIAVFFEKIDVQLLGSDTNCVPVIPSSVPAAEEGSAGVKMEQQIENTSETGNQIPLHPLERKNGRVKDDTKCLIVQCHSPSVLSEMPVVTNGLSNTTCGNDDGLEQDCGNGVHARFQNAFNSLVKAKFARVKRVSQFASVTPCSIAVGADERAACDRFAFRHNGFCRTLRTSRVICNGRNRNDSTGNADSDESLENLSENSFGLSESPQDGNRKRPSCAVKRTERKKPNLNAVSANSQVAESDSKTAEPVTSGGNACVSHAGEIVSDEDTCYYEGVDSSDIFINNCSSDESVSSNADSKQNNSVTAADTANENQDSLLIPCDSSDKQKEEEEDDEKCNKKDTDLPPLSFLVKEPLSTTMYSSSPSERLRRSSGQKAQEKLKVFSDSRKSFSSSVREKAETVIDLTNESTEQHSTSPHNKYESLGSNSAVRSLREQNRNSNKCRPLILGHRPGGKYPVVVLEKSTPVTPSSAIKQEQLDHADLVESSLRDSSATVTSDVALKVLTSGSGDKLEPHFKVENIDFAVTFENNSNDRLIKTDPEEGVEIKDVRQVTADVAIRMRKKKPARRKAKKRKGEAKSFEKVSRDTEVKDSFKSMKFSRTLDLMKSRRRREQASVGPFIRVIGKQNKPDSVTVFTQPVHESSVGLSSGKHKHSKNRHVLPQSTTTTIHMVTNLPMDKAAMVSSSRTISHNPWVCAFCAHHSSYRFLGDLYGPYFKESEIPRVERIAAEENKKGESFKDQKSSDSSSTRRSKDSFLPERKSFRKGKSPLQSKSIEPSPSPPEEVWVHEECAMWSPGVYLIGNKLYGLDEAVRDAAETVCSACKSKGAMIGCLHKGCSMKYHFICAIDKDCYMEEEKLSLLCPKHKSKRLKSAADSPRS